MGEGEINIQVSETPRGHRGKKRQRQKRQPPKLALAIVAGLVLVVSIATIFLVSSLSDTSSDEVDAEGEKPAEEAARQVASQKEQTPAAKPPAEGDLEKEAEDSRETLIDDDGETLWASPTAGEAISLEYIPAGTPMLLHLRPAELLAHPEGEKVFAGLGPWGAAVASSLEEKLGHKLQDIENLLLGVLTLSSNELAFAARVQLAEPTNFSEIQQRHLGGRVENIAGQKTWRVGELTYFVPKDSKLLVMCPAEFASDSISGGEVTPSLVRDLQRLLAHTDSDRMATLMLSPRFLDAGGSRLLVDAGERLRNALDWLMDREATAIVISLHWDENFFAELRTTPQLQAQPRRYSQQLAERIQAAATLVEDQVIAGNWPPYARKVLARFPAMLRKFSGYTRAAVEDRHVVLRTYLPLVAGHNLLTASELLLTQSPLRSVQVSSATTGPADELTIEQRLAKVTSLSFPKDTLEQALNLLAEDIGVPITILGRDLQLEGITKNQSFGINLRDKPAEEILLEILLLANPDRTATGPAEPKQKLVYVVRDNPPGIEVTTRTSVEKRGNKLPSIFTGTD